MRLMRTLKTKFNQFMLIYSCPRYAGFSSFCLGRLGLIATLIILSGCASQVTETTATETNVNESNVSEQSSSPLSPEQIKEAAKDIPERTLDEETMALLLEAEFALYRQDIETALGIYEQLAQETLDQGIAKRATEVAMATSDPFRALDAALLYLELAPEDNYAIQLAARALARSAEVEGAWALLEEHQGKTHELRMMSAEAVRLAGQMKDNYQIEWLLQQILQKYGTTPEDNEVQLAIAIIFEALGDFENAAIYAQQANNLDPENLLALRLHANSLLRTGKKGEAAELLSNWINAHTEKSEARISLAQMLVSFDPPAALPILEMLSAEYPWSGQLLMSTAQLHLASSNQQAAIPYYQKLTQFGNFRNISLFNLGRIYEQKNELKLAAEYYASVGAEETAADEDNLVFESNLRQARIEYKIGESGALLFEELRQLYPDQSQGLIHEESRILLELEELEAAVKILSIGIEDFPDSEALLYTRSIAYDRIGNIDGAIADLTTILSFDDSNAVALNALGYTLANRTDRYEEAYDLIDRALAIDPEDPAIIDSMGWVLYHMGRYEESLQYLQQAYDAMLDEEVISHLAEVLWKLERNEEAKQILEQGEIDLPDSNLIPKTRKKLGLES